MEPPYVTSVCALDDYELEVVFENGERRNFDVKPYLTGGVFVRLRDRSLFQAVRAVAGSIEWPGEIDLSYETLYIEGQPIREHAMGVDNCYQRDEQREPLWTCPNPLPRDLEQMLDALAVVWAKHTIRPRIEPSIAARWDALIESWSNDESLPLLIRKKEPEVVRGELVTHDSGRALVVTDNSPAWWSYYTAFCEQVPSLSDIRRALEEDSIPVAMVLTQEMIARARYKCTVAAPSPNSLGWKVCHKRKVALRGGGSIRKRRLADLQDHFREFLSPSNLFLMPKRLGGLGELSHFIEAIGREPHGL